MNKRRVDYLKGETLPLEIILKYKLAHPVGIKPTPRGLEALVLSLHQGRKLATSRCGMLYLMVAEVGFEPTHHRVKVYCVTTSPLGTIYMVELVGIEPTSHALQACANPSQLKFHIIRDPHDTHESPKINLLLFCICKDTRPFAS